MSTSPSTMAKRSGHPGGAFVFVGALFCAAWVIAFLAQIATNEAWVAHGGKVNIWAPDWSILLQIPNMLLGNLSASDGMASFVGWMIELVFLGFILGFEIMHHAAGRSGALMAKLFFLLSVGVVLLNGYTDWHYGSIGSGDMGRWVFAIVLSASVGFAGTIGIAFIEHGWKKV